VAQGARLILDSFFRPRDFVSFFTPHRQQTCDCILAETGELSLRATEISPASASVILFLHP